MEKKKVSVTCVAMSRMFGSIRYDLMLLKLQGVAVSNAAYNWFGSC